MRVLFVCSSYVDYFNWRIGLVDCLFDRDECKAHVIKSMSCVTLCYLMSMN